MNTECQTDRGVSFPHHISIIMGGNGRWAQGRGPPRTAGHQAGVRAARRVIEACVELRVGLLALYTFSAEDWRRPPDEVVFLLNLTEEYARHELTELRRNGVLPQLMGRREGLPASLLNALDQTIVQTRDNSHLVLNLALNYSGRAEVVDAIKALLIAHDQGALDDSLLDETAFARYLYCPDSPDADLVIRTGGEWQLGSFLLWRASGAVFWNTPVLWPDFWQEHILQAIEVPVEQATARDSAS